MSVQFGKCNFDGKAVDPKDLDQVRPALAPYGQDGEGSICQDNVGVLYRAFHGTKESRLETQPHRSASGAIIVWDGRLDNREELIGQLGAGVSADCSDLELVARGYGRWGTNLFARLMGDWALSIWDAKDRSLTLAKDFMGTRHLYYSAEKEQVTWCTILDPLVMFAGRSLTLDEEYIAGWLSFFPAPNLTPYVGIHSVPPSSFVRLAKGTHTITKYWEFDPGKVVSYPTDADYEEHFRVVFARSVRRRLRSHFPILAELSGGMDSSSIVCMADSLAGEGLAETPRIDTLSYYDDSEPNWNERPYFTQVEQKRGRTGCHIDVGSPSSLDFAARVCFAFTPGASFHGDEVNGRFVTCLTSQGHRVVLSGIGGDEVTGGVPTPMPELADSLARCRFARLAHQLRIWSLDKRQPWFHLLLGTAREFLPTELVGIAKRLQPAPWLSSRFFNQHRAALIAYETRLKLFGPLPSFQVNLNTLDALRRQLACCALPSSPTYERRYPYLDRSLLEFLYAIPQEQLLRPGQRRSLMRRALTGIVPDELLNRKRKAYVSNGLTKTILAQWRQLNETSQQLVSNAIGVVEGKSILDTIESVMRGSEVPTLTLMRTLMLESWLRDAMRCGVLDGSVCP